MKFYHISSKTIRKMLPLASGIDAGLNGYRLAEARPKSGVFFLPLRHLLKKLFIKLLPRLMNGKHLMISVMNHPVLHRKPLSKVGRQTGQDLVLRRNIRIQHSILQLPEPKKSLITVSLSKHIPAKLKNLFYLGMPQMIHNLCAVWKLSCGKHCSKDRIPFLPIL